MWIYIEIENFNSTSWLTLHSIFLHKAWNTLNYSREVSHKTIFAHKQTRDNWYGGMEHAGIKAAGIRGTKDTRGTVKLINQI